VTRKVARARPVVIDPLGPPAVRQTRLRCGGSTAVMSAEWFDPDDLRPNSARHQRRLKGWRAFCSLRRIQMAGGGLISDRHIMAADKLRERADIALLGFTGANGGGVGPGPRSGPSMAAMAQVLAGEDIRRALRPFSRGQRDMLVYVVLLNHSIASWCEHDREEDAPAGENVKIALGRLVALLDILVEHYRLDVDADIRAGERLA
jgi:hypothetical protein